MGEGRRLQVRNRKVGKATRRGVGLQAPAVGCSPALVGSGKWNRSPGVRKTLFRNLFKLRGDLLCQDDSEIVKSPGLKKRVRLDSEGIEVESSKWACLCDQH